MSGKVLASCIRLNIKFILEGQEAAATIICRTRSPQPAGDWSIPNGIYILAFLRLANHHCCRPECISRVTRPVAQRFLAQALQLLVHLVAVMPERLIRRPEMGSVNDGTSRYPHLLPQSRLRGGWRQTLYFPVASLASRRRARPASHAVGTQPSASGEQPWH